MSVGIGQLATVTGRLRSKKLKNSVLDSHPVLDCFKENGGIKREDGGRTVVEEFKYAQNSTVGWIGENEEIPINDSEIVDAAEFDWKYLGGSYTITKPEVWKNSGGGDTKLIDIVTSKQQVLEDTMKNKLHAGLLSAGVAASGKQLGGLGLLVSKTPATGTIGGIDVSNADAAFFRNYDFDTSADWSDGSADAGNIKRLYDKAINNTCRGVDKVKCALAGQTHFEFITQASQAMQQIQNESKTGKIGFDHIVYRGVKVYFGGGVSFSGESLVQDDLTYFLNPGEGKLQLVYHKDAEFELLEPVQSQNQAAVTRLMITMCAMTTGLRRMQAVVYDS